LSFLGLSGLANGAASVPEPERACKFSDLDRRAPGSVQALATRKGAHAGIRGRHRADISLNQGDEEAWIVARL